MAAIKYICISDLHLGADNSLLTKVDLDRSEANPILPSEVLVRFGQCLKSLGTLNSGGHKPQLILNGDVLELALAHDNEAIMAFERFMEILFPDGEEPLVANEIIFVPGNHDHHLWETARETQYAEFLKKNPPSTPLEAPWHTTKMFDADPVNAFLLTTVIRRYERMKEVSIQTVYPNLGFISEDGGKTVIFTHGHFAEPIYTAMSQLRKFLFPDSQMPVQVWDIEEENFAWIDFFWSTMGRSGAVGDDVERIYMMLLEPEMRGKLAHLLGHAMAGAWIPHLPGGSLLLGALASALLGHVSGLEKTKGDGPISAEASAGLKAYVEGPLRNQFAADRKIIPSQAAIVFGHTHKPFVQEMSFAGFPTQTTVFNTGGWVVDTAEEASTHGAAMVLVDEKWNVAALRIYNEGDYEVKVDAAQPGATPNMLVSELERYLTQHAEPWAALSTAIALTVDSYHKDVGERLNAMKSTGQSKSANAV